MRKEQKTQIKKIITAAIFMVLGLLLLKYLPMQIWGAYITFDASQHITTACLALYILWFFIDQNRSWCIPFFIFSALILFVISVQRLLVHAHSDIGLALGLLVSLVSIGIAERKYLKNKVKF